MTKKRKQAVGHPAEVKLTPEEFASHCFEALIVAEDRIERLYKCSARWKALAKLYYKKLSGMGIRRRWQTGRKGESR